jgi:AcrR family transcriptional regulator
VARPRLIDRAAVLDAALAVADEGGIDAVTMAAVGRSLGVSAMALYRHVEDKADLLDGLVERLLDEVPLPDPDLDAVDRLTALGAGIRATARRHPHVFPLLLARPAATPEARRRRDLVVALLQEIGVPAAEAPRIERLISTMVLGFAASEAAGRFAHHPPAVVEGDWAALQEIVRLTIVAPEPLAGSPATRR